MWHSSWALLKNDHPWARMAENDWVGVDKGT